MVLFQFSMWRRKPASASTFLLFGIVSTDGHAGPARSETTEIHLRYSRQDLASPAATRRLLARIGDAALEACGASPFSLAEFKVATRSSECWRKAVDEATRRIESPTLTALASKRVD
jgi:UrcA family protein